MMSQLIKLGLMSPEAPHNLLSITQQMWANNGDVISKQYAGTNALKVSQFFIFYLLKNAKEQIYIPFQHKHHEKVAKCF